jgi:hypothetical protein
MQKCIGCAVHQSIRRISARAGTHPCLNRDAALQKPRRTLGFGCKHGPRGICHSNAALPHPHECTGSQRAPGFCCFIANSIRTDAGAVPISRNDRHCEEEQRSNPVWPQVLRLNRWHKRLYPPSHQWGLQRHWIASLALAMTNGEIAPLPPPSLRGGTTKQSSLGRRCYV